MCYTKRLGEGVCCIVAINGAIDGVYVVAQGRMGLWSGGEKVGMSGRIKG